MIGWLKGLLLEKQAPGLLIEVAGVGYEVQAPMTTCYQLPAAGETVQLYIHTVTREDGSVLYGFAQKMDRALFRALIKVNGVGPKLALAVLSGMDAATLVNCIVEHDVASLVRVPGVGKKTAERMTIELSDRLSTLQKEVLPSDQITVNPATLGKKSGAESARDDAMSALVALGYKPQQARQAIMGLATQTLASEEIIRQALQNLAR